MMRNILVSIGMPVYNGEKYIKVAINSVLNQTYTNFELIITDDGSNDKTLELIKEYKDDRIIVISENRNRGISYRLNQQIDLARGKYFIRMDADDIMFPDRIEKQIQYLEAHPKVDVVGSKVIVIDENNKIIGERGSVTPITSINQLFFSTRFIHPTVAGKTSWFKKWKYRNIVSGCEDFDLWIRSYHDSIFVDMPESLVFYRDPLKFKLRTYLFRLYKVTICVCSLHRYMKSKVLLFRIICRNLFAALVAIFLSLIHRDYLMIAKRNRVIDNLDYYKIKLEEVLNHKKYMSKQGIQSK